MNFALIIMHFVLIGEYIRELKEKREFKYYHRKYKITWKRFILTTTAALVIELGLIWYIYLVK